MSALLFLAGFEKETKPDDVTNYISDAFDKNEVLQLWMDPNRKARAVALLKKKLDTKEVEALCREVKLRDKSILTEPTKPVESVFVKHKENGELCFGIVDKLKFLFTSQRYIGCTVTRVELLDSLSCEVYLKGGWDAVQKVCERSWKEQQLKVVPYFECFKEDIQKQLKRIPSQDQKKKKDKHDKETANDTEQKPGNKSHGSSSGDEWSDEKVAMQPLPKSDESDREMEVDVATHDTSDEENTPHTASVSRKQKKDNSKQAEAGKQNKVSNIVFNHDFVWRFLIMLQFEKTVTGMFPKLKIESDGGEAVIKGEDRSVETVEKILQQANPKVTKKLERLLHQNKQMRQELLHECDEFLSRSDIQEELEEYISEERLSIVLDEAEGKLSVMVANDKDSGKVPFPEFVSSQIRVKECLCLPDDKFGDDPKWLNFVSSLKKKYPLLHITVVDKSVFLFWLTCRSGGSDTVTKKITKFIEKLNVPVSDDGAVASVTHEDDSMSESGKTKKKSKTTVSVGGLSQFFVWVLDTVKIEEAAKNVKSNFSVCIDEEDINVSGYKEDVGALKTLLRAINKMLFYSDDQEEFLSSETVQQYLKQFLASVKLHIEMSQNLHVEKSQNMSITVILEDDKEKDLEEFITSLARREKCGSLPQGLNHNERQEWQTLTQDVHRKHPFLKVFVEDDKVSVLTVEMQDYSKSEKVIEKINGFIKSKTAMSSEKSSDTRMMSASRQQVPEFSAHLQPEHKNMCSVQKTLSFPGLVPFFESQDGKDLIKHLEVQYGCIFEYGNRSQSSGMRLESQEATEDSVGLQYNVAMLTTARCPGFNIHLMQGEMHDLSVEMKITLQTSKEVSDCELKRLRSSMEVMVLLPPWKVPKDGGFHEYFEKLRDSWREKCVMPIFLQAQHLKWPSMAISTKDALNADDPFPADVIAQAITEQLLSMFRTSYSSFDDDQFDLYICEPEKETIFNAFKYHMSQHHKYFVDIDQASWDKVCYEKPYSFKDFNGKYNVEVTDSVVTHEWSSVLANGEIEALELPTFYAPQKWKTLFCYPIHSSLEVESFPANKEMFFPGWKVADKLKRIQRRHGGDGPLDGEVIPDLLLEDREGIVICCPEWSMGCQKVMAYALKTFLCSARRNHDTVCIVPPGMHYKPWYPKQFLAQTFFRELDELLRNNEELKRKRIIVVVDNQDYRKTFEEELRKRKPKQKKEGFLHGFKTLLGLDETVAQGKGGSMKTVVKSTVPTTKVTFLCGKSDDGERAARYVEQELNNLMEQNRETKGLNKKQTQDFMNIIKDAQYMEVQITIEHQYIKETPHGPGKKKKKKKRKNNSTHAQAEKEKIVLAGSVVKVEGLTKDLVRAVTNIAMGQPSPSATGATGGAEVYRQSDSSDDDEEEEDMPSADFSATSKELNVNPEPHGLDKRSSSGKETSQNKFESAQLNTRWQYETRRKDFQYMDMDIERQIESAYLNGKDGVWIKNGGPFLNAYFATMTVTISDKETGMIRTELIDEPARVTFPPSWQLDKHQSFNKRKIERSTDVFKDLERNLQTCIDKRVSLAKIESIENFTLYRRTIAKRSQLTSSSEILMWHRVKEDYKDVACEYGFNPLFSAMPKAEHLGDGVLFYSDARKCFSLTEGSGGEIFLLRSIVYAGKSGHGSLKLRQAPFFHGGEQYDSTADDTSVMVFSDAQAYPLYLVTLSVKKK